MVSIVLPNTTSPEFGETRVNLARQRLHSLAIKHNSVTEVGVVHRAVAVPDVVDPFVAQQKHSNGFKRTNAKGTTHPMGLGLCVIVYERKQHW